MILTRADFILSNAIKLALVERKLGNNDVSRNLLEQAFPKAQSVLDRSGKTFYLAIKTLALIYSEIPDFEKHNKLYVSNIEQLDSEKDDQRRIKSEFCNNLGSSLNEQGRPEEADKWIELSLELRGSPEEEKSAVATAITLDNKALVFQKQSKYQDAEQQCLKALAFAIKHLDYLHPTVMKIRANLVMHQLFVNKFAEAEKTSLSLFQLSELIPKKEKYSI